MYDCVCLVVICCIVGFVGSKGGRPYLDLGPLRPGTLAIN
jgi:hypothetical protein